MSFDGHSFILKIMMSLGCKRELILLEFLLSKKFNRNDCSQLKRNFEVTDFLLSCLRPKPLETFLELFLKFKKKTFICNLFYSNNSKRCAQ